MDEPFKMFQDRDAVEVYAQIQKRITHLSPDSDKELIDEIFEAIPPNYLEEKDRLMMIAQLFASLARTHFNMSHVVIFLFEKILDKLKIYLSDESSFFWNIFGGMLYFKLWMYEEGLITIEKIIQAAQLEKGSTVTEYFLPEIIENESDYFHKELKFKYPKIYNDENSYSKESIEKVKNLRKKHFCWLKNSGDRHHPSYLEIEKDPLRLAIKLDDVSSFQKILSHSNISINSTIRESLIEKYFITPCGLSLIDFSLEYSSINIFKFLLINDATMNSKSITSAIFSGNYEMVHIVESKLKSSFEKNSLLISIASWNQKIVNYLIENYDFNQKLNNEIKNDFRSDRKEESQVCMLSIISQSFYSLNFRFIKKTIIPFFDNNPKYVTKNIHNMLFKSFYDMSGFFAREILKHPKININYISKTSGKNFLFTACSKNNCAAVRELLNHPDINVNEIALFKFSPLYGSCALYCDMKIIKMLCDHPKIDVESVNQNDGLTTFQISLSRGNAAVVKFLSEKYKNIEKVEQLPELASFCLDKRHLLTLKFLIQFFMDKFDHEQFQSVVQNIKVYINSLPNFNERFIDELDQILDEVK